MSQGSKKTIGLIGAGHWGKNLIRVFNQFGVLKTICDLDKEILEERKKEYPDLQFTTDFSEILKDKGIKGVVISAPVAIHYKLAKAVLRAGKDVFVEKPLALRVKEGEELVEISQKKKLILMVGHLYFYHPGIIKLKEMIKNGELGKIRYIWSNRLNFGILRREENVLWSFAPHDISIIIDILGLPEEVWAYGKNYLQQNIPDITLTFLQFKNGKAGHIFVSWLNPFKEQKLAVVGVKKMAVFDDQVKDKLVVYPHRVEFRQNENPKAMKAEGEIINFPEAEPLLEEAKHFLECIKKRKTPITCGKEALEVLKVLDACQRSLEKHGKPIKLIK